MLSPPTEEQIEQFVLNDFLASNNETKYKAMIINLDLALTLTTSKVEVRSDSQLMVRQIQREYEVKDESMAHYLTGVEVHLDKLVDWRVKHIPHEENEKADALARVVVVLPITESIMLLVYVQPTSFITSERFHDIARMDMGWMQPIVNYLYTCEALENGKKTHKFHFQVARFTLINDQLYKRSFGWPYLKCLIDLEAQYVLVELHEGICGNHLGRRILAH